MKKKRQIYAILLCASLLISLIPIYGLNFHAAAATNHSKNEAIEWIKARGNENWWKDVDNTYGCQCVDLIYAYYEYLVGYRLGGNAKDYLSDSKLPNGWWRDNTPSEGAIIVWGAYTYTGQWTTGANGHVGLVYSVSGSNVYTVETNTGGTNGQGSAASAQFRTRKNVNASYIHPDFNDGGNASDIKYASITPGNYQIINRAGGKYLNAFANAGQAKEQTNVCASNADSSAEQKWKIESLGSSKYLIRSNSNSNLFCLDIATSGTPSSGTNVYLYSNTGYASKHWYFESLNNGYYVIRSALNPNLVLAAVDGNHRANVQVQSYNGGNNQQWQLSGLDSTPVTLSKISVASLPTKTSYYPWESLNASGLSLKLSYSDGSSKTVSSGFSCSPTGFSTYIGTKTITVTYEGKSTSFNVNVNAPSSNYNYTKLKTFSYNGRTYEIYKENTSYANAKAFAEQKGGHLLTVTEKAENDAVMSNWDTKATVCEYLWLGGNDTKVEGSFVWDTNEAFSYTNWETGEPNNEQDEDYMIMYPNGRWNDSSSDGRAFCFCVEYEKVASISIESMPTKVEYNTDETFDSSGLKLNVTYTDCSRKIIDQGFSCTCPDLHTPGTKTVTVSYAGCTISFTVIVNEKTDEIYPPTSESSLDFNKDGEVNSRDGIYLIYYTVFPEDFPISSAINLDFNNDGEINSRDGIYLIYYTVFPEDFPIDLHLPSLHLSSAEAECGNTVTLTLSADNLDAVSEIIINNFEIENSQISLVSCNILPTKPDVTDFEPNKKIAILVNKSNLNLSGKLLELTFEIPNNTAPGRYTVSFKSIVNMYDDDEKLLNLPTDNSFGTIIVY